MRKKPSSRSKNVSRALKSSVLPLAPIDDSSFDSHVHKDFLQKDTLERLLFLESLIALRIVKAHYAPDFQGSDMIFQRNMRLMLALTKLRLLIPAEGDSVSLADSYAALLKDIL